MKLTKYAQAVKTELAMELAKHGESLESFEAMLDSINTGEGVLKVAGVGMNILQDTFMNPAAEALKSVPEVGWKASLAGGAIAGLSMDDMDNSVDSLNKSLERERQKVHLVRRITANLKREHGIT